MPQDPLKPRKQPKQARSRQMHADILEAAVRVLAGGDPTRFTMVRVAEVAGISVGSLYQYYPNKEALLVALHEREVEDVWIDVKAIVRDADLAPRERVHRTVALFFRRESAEPPAMRRLMADSESAARKSPTFLALMADAQHEIGTFLAQALPAPARDQSLAFPVDVFFTTIASLGRAVCERPMSPEALDRWAQTCSDMLCDYFKIA
jgi:AcrR family transcriptional regulator